MKRLTKSNTIDEVEYPSSDGKPIAETQIHIQVFFDIVPELKNYFRNAPNVYVGADMMMYYVQGDNRTHVVPNIFVVQGIKKLPLRDNYLVWKEGKAPDLVIEVTSASTKNEDLRTKYKLYRDVLKVSEYFIFDPLSEYLRPTLQGYSLNAGRYTKIRSINGRLPSKVLGLHLEGADSALRLFDTTSGEWLPTPSESHEFIRQLQLELAGNKANGGARTMMDLLTQQGVELRPWQMNQWLPNAEETYEFVDQLKLARKKAIDDASLITGTMTLQELEAATRADIAATRVHVAARKKAEAEIKILRMKIEALRKKQGKSNTD